jgi:hypothetical protein
MGDLSVTLWSRLHALDRHLEDGAPPADWKRRSGMMACYTSFPCPVRRACDWFGHESRRLVVHQLLAAMTDVNLVAITR